MNFSGRKTHSNLLADNGESDNENLTACEKILAEEKAKSELPMVEKTASWLKDNEWFPWAVAGGFGLLWLTKRKNKGN